MVRPPRGRTILWYTIHDMITRASTPKFHVTIEKDEDGVFVVSCPSLPGCHSQGVDVEDALANIKSAIMLYLKHTDPTYSRMPVEVDVIATDAETSVAV